MVTMSAILLLYYTQFIQYEYFYSVILWIPTFYIPGKILVIAGVKHFSILVPLWGHLGLYHVFEGMRH